MVIRPARLEDLPDAQAVARRTIDARFRYFLGDEDVDAFLESGASDAELEEHLADLHVMIADGAVVGFTILLGDLLHLMMIDEARHRTGLGSELLRYAEGRLFADHDAIRLSTFDGNEQAIRFYLKHGWRETHQAAAPDERFVRRFFEKRST